jgi:hypothetical protein
VIIFVGIVGMMVKLPEQDSEGDAVRIGIATISRGTVEMLALRTNLICSIRGESATVFLAGH